MPVEINGELWITWAEVRELALERAGVQLGSVPGRIYIAVSRTFHTGEKLFLLEAVEARIELWVEVMARDVEQLLSRPAKASE